MEQTNASSPNIQTVRPDAGQVVHVGWKGGSRSIIDLSRFTTRYRIFAPLRDDNLFRAVTVGEWGWCIRWSEDMEIASDTLWRLAQEQTSK